MSRKILVGLLVLALFLTLPLATPVNAATTKWCIEIDWNANEPLANADVIFTVFDVTDNEPVLVAVGTTDEDGRLWWDSAAWCNATPVDETHSFNYTLLINEYGKTFLLAWSPDTTGEFPDTTGVSWATIESFIGIYEDDTEVKAPTPIYATHRWGLWFQARDYWTGLPLYFKKKVAEDIAYFQVYLVDHAAVPIEWDAPGNDTYAAIWEAWGNEDAYSVREPGSDTLKLLNISDTRVETDPANCYVITDVFNTTLVKELWWLLGVSHQDTSKALKVQVGEDVLTFNYLISAKTVELNVTSNVGFYGFHPSATYTLTGSADNKYGPVEDYAWTKFKGVYILDCNGSYFDYIWPVKVEFKAFIDGKWKAIRDGQADPDYGYAPWEGVDPFTGEYIVDGFFWLPDITLPELYGVNYTIYVNYYGVTVHISEINSTEIGAPREPIEVNELLTTIKPVIIEVEDKEPEPQPLEGALIVLTMKGYDFNLTTQTVKDPQTGRTYVVLPPYIMWPTRLPGAEYSAYFPKGYLPVPYNLTEFEYEIKVYWRSSANIHYEGAPWIDVTWEENSTLTIGAECKLWSFVVMAEVYQANIQLVDMCGQPLTLEDYPHAIVRLFDEGGTPILDAHVTSVGEGVLFLDKIPKGVYSIKLLWKGVWIEPKNETKSFEVLDNVVDAIVFEFPIGDVNITLTQWDDCDLVLDGLNATLIYYWGDKEKWREPWARSDCDGVVTFEKVPLVPFEGGNITLVVYTGPWDDNGDGDYNDPNDEAYTPYTRGEKDNNIMVYLGDLHKDVMWDVGPYYEDLQEAGTCVAVGKRPVWIYSFDLWAVDHDYNILTEFSTDVGTYPVAVALVDTDYGFESPTCGPPGCCVKDVLIDYKIINFTGEGDTGHFNGIPEAKFVYTSRQYDRAYPHLFVAGATYQWMVFHGGVLVFNYTVELPRPDQDVTYIYNETSKTYEVVTGFESKDYVWTWWDEDDGYNKTHPILTIKSIAACEGKPTLELVTWTQTLTVYTISNAGYYMAPNLNLSLTRVDVLNLSFISDPANYDDIVGENWIDQGISYAWSTLDEDDGTADGVIVVTVPVWQPRDTAYTDMMGVKFGVYMTDVDLLAGDDWGTPGVVGTPYYDYSNRRGVIHKYFGYPVMWNHTDSTICYEPCNYYPTWYKELGGVWYEFRGNDTWYAGDCWNMTYWSGAAKIVHTTMMDAFCVVVYGHDFHSNKVPLEGQLVAIEVNGSDYDGTTNVEVTDTLVDWTDGYVTDADGKVVFEPTKGASVTLPDGSTLPVAGGVVAWKFDVDFCWIPDWNVYLSYNFGTRQNYEKLLEPYGLTPEDVMTAEVETLWSGFLKFGEEHNNAEECIELEWGFIKLTIEDWTGNPLKDMLVLAIPQGQIHPSTFAFTDQYGRVVLHVADGPYEIKVYWRDTYFLDFAGVIPRALDIYDSFADEMIPRAYYPGDSATIKTRVYGALLKIRDAEGDKLSSYDPITVTIYWPDKVITKHKPDEQGVVRIVMNKDTIVEMTGFRSPESPVEVPQAPEGEYKVVVEWDGVGVIAEQSIRIEAGKFEAGATVSVEYLITTDVYDMTVAIKTPFDTPMAGADVTLKKMDGTEVKTVVGSDGTVAITEVPLGTVDVTVHKWKGMNVGFTKTGVTVTENTVIVDKIGMVKVKVVGQRGQGLAGAEVVLEGTPIKGTTTADGTFFDELPAGSYTVKVSYGGKEKTATASVTGGQVTEVVVELPVFIEIAGWSMDMSAFIGMLLLIVLLIIVLFILLHEYSVWRRRKIAAAVVPVKPSA